MSDDYAEYLERTKTPSEEFEEMYGFPHDCVCASDWETGNCGVVSECFMRLSDDALARCHKYKGEVADLERKMAVLRNQVSELDGEPRV